MDTAPDGTYVTYPYPRFQKWTEKATNGRIKIDTTVELLDDPLVGAIEGRVDIGYDRIPFVSGTFPLWDFGSFPFFWSDSHEYEEALNDPTIKQIIEASFEEAGLVRMFEGPSGPNDLIYSNNQYLTLDDLQGAKIRSAGAMTTETMRLVGAAPLTLSVTELVDALTRGTVDGINTNYAFGMEIGLTDIAPYASVWPMTSEFSQVFAINRDAFYSLPTDLQGIMREVFADMQAQSFVGGHEARLVAVSAIRATPIEIVTPEQSEIEAAAQLITPDIFEWYVNRAGPQAQQILDVAAQYGTGPAALAAR
jgi:TRAP-type C4-dicarboxylate transport system substrate-binding protein